MGWAELPGHRQLGRDVERHRLNARADRPESSQSQQVESCGSQRGHRAGAITAVMVGILMELGVANPVPAVNALAISHQLQQRFWRGAQAGEKHMGGPKGLASRLPLAVTSTIQLLPTQVSAMCVGACVARRVQVMVRPWLIS